MQRSFLKALLVIISSGLMYYYSIGFHTLWPLMWFMPIPVLVYAYQESLIKTLIVSFIVGLAPGLNDFIGYTSTYLPASNLILEILIDSVVWAAVILMSRFFVRRIFTPVSIFAYPTLLVLTDWIEALTPQGTFNTIAYSQLPALPVMQIASLVGFSGVTFIVSIFASAIAYAIIHYKRDQLNSIIALSISAILIVLSIAFGIFRVYHDSAITSPHVKIGLAATDRSSLEVYNPDLAPSLISEYQPLIASLASQGAEVILLPQVIASVTAETQNQAISELGNMAKQNHIILIAGVYIDGTESSKSQQFDAAWLFDEDGNLIGEYDKENFIPYLEEHRMAGAALLRFTLADQTAGISISRDMDYINPSHDYGKFDTRILFVPAWDFDVDQDVNIQGALTRSIENGFTLVRAARAGLLSVSTRTGQMVGMTSDVDKKETTLLVDTPLSPSNTFYARHNNEFIWLLWAIFAFLLFRASFKRS